MPILVLLLIPILGYATYFWLNSIVNEELTDLGLTAQEMCAPDFVEIWENAGLAVSELNAACEEIYPIFWLGDASLYSGIASVIFLFLIVLLPFVAGTNRSRLSSIFSVLVPFTLVFVAISTLVQGGIITYSLYAVQVNLMEAWYPFITLGIGLGALFVAFSVISAAFSINRQVTMQQMAIDADLSSGLISEDEARKRREDLSSESTFFGAMDGASKFVRGDAVAGLLITLINVLGGIIIGVAQQDLTFKQASQTYTLLTVGDGLVSQIPALIVSTAAGLLVTKSGTTGSTDKAVFSQLGGYPKALMLSALLMVGLSLLPGIPMIPFMGVAACIGTICYFLFKAQSAEEIKNEKLLLEAANAPIAEEPISSALHIDLVRLELGYGLLPLVSEESENYRLTDQIKALRRQIASENGFIMPQVRIQDNLQLPANTYVVRIKEIEVGSSDIRPNRLLVMDSLGNPIDLPGTDTVEPTFGLPAMWVDPENREEATFKGYTVVDPATVITTHITELIRDNMQELLSYTETQNLLDELPTEHQKLVADVIPNQISVGGVQRVLQNLLGERISIRDLPTILEGISEACAFTRNATQITDHVRSRLARQISEQNSTDDNFIPLVTLSTEWEQIFAESIIENGEERQLSMAPSQLQNFINNVRTEMDDYSEKGESPVMLTSPAIRPFVRSIVERFRPETEIMSQNEIHPKAKIKTLGQI